MVFQKLKGASFKMGTDSGVGFLEDYEGPAKEVTVADFSINDATVTNAEFQAFVQATGYQTVAEEKGWSFVFHLLATKEVQKQSPTVAGSPWWLEVAGASWQHPFGPDSDLTGLEEHPVVHIALPDAIAYCKWKGVALPTEAQWEYAARAGVETEYPWGDSLNSDGQYFANTWQGTFPTENTAQDGFVGTAPVYHYPPNKWGLYQMIGNVWEWCINPRYTLFEDFNEQEFTMEQELEGEYAIRGGSFLCHCSYCNRYRLAARNGVDYQSTSSHLGFRVVKVVG